MKKVLSIMFLSILSIGICFGTSVKAEQITSITEVLSLGSDTCIKDKTTAKQKADEIIHTLYPTKSELLASIAYKVNGVYVMDAKGDNVYICDNPEVAIRTSFDNCVVDKYYLDEAHTKELTISSTLNKIGQIPTYGLSYVTDNNGCITGVKYISTIYVTCKSNVTPTPTTTTTTKKVSTTTKSVVTGTPAVTTVPVSKDNPETGDNIWIYLVAGVILVAGCAVVLKKVASKE